MIFGLDLSALVVASLVARDLRLAVENSYLAVRCRQSHGPLAVLGRDRVVVQVEAHEAGLVRPAGADVPAVGRMLGTRQEFWLFLAQSIRPRQAVRDGG